MLEILYILDEPEQTRVLPLIELSAPSVGVTVMERICAEPVPQEFVAVTIKFPLFIFAVVLIIFVPEIPVHPEGVVHVYEVAPVTKVTLYVLEELSQILILPLIVPGEEGIVLTVTDKV
jgi:hypothetical protein